MSFDSLRVAIANKFTSEWVGSNADIGGNKEIPFQLPTDGSGWVRLTHHVFDTNNAAIGSDFQRSVGEIVVQCFVPINSGEKKLSDLIDSVVSIFQNENFGGVDCYASNPVRIGDTKDGNWYQCNVATPFRYDVFS